MIQLRRIRTYTPKGSEPKSIEQPLTPPQEYENLHAVFKNLAAILEKIPADDRWNIYYTLGHTDGDYHRNWAAQDVIPFDIDGVVDEAGEYDHAAYMSAIFHVLGVDEKKCIVVSSGNGLQILVQPERRIEDKAFFRTFRSSYERLCEEIAAELTSRGLRFKEVDPSSFAMNRIFRLPGTENRKPDRPVRRARLLNATLEPQPFHITPLEAGDARTAPEKEQLTPKQLRFFAVDTEAVETGCAFLRWAKTHQSEVNESQWYAMLSVVGRLDDGRQRAHSYSSEHPSYSERETDRKIDQALAASGPRTCENIDQVWGECADCPHFKKVTSPIALKGDTFVATERSGFYLLGKNGGLTPQFEDLRRYFEKENAYKTHEDSGEVYVFDGRQYERSNDHKLRNYAHLHFNPPPAEHVASEFVAWVNRTNLAGSSWFADTTRGKLNFANCVLDVETSTCEEHSPARGFLYHLPYPYKADATAPAFDRFMDEVTCGDRQLVDLMLEFVGYALCSSTYWLQKALLLIGEGSNGKSTFLKVVQMLAGEKNVGHLSLEELSSETSRAALEGKLINISDELPNYSIRSTELLKKLFGGTMTARHLYHDSVTVENMAKFIFAGNAIPSTNDVSEGFFRRMVIVPFKATFSLEDKTADSTLLEKMEAELPGIFNRVFGHYQALKARGHLVQAEAAKSEHARYREEVDRVGSWIKENLYWNGSWGTDKPYTPTAAIFERYVSDCKRGEEKPLPKYHMTRHLRKHIDHFDERHQRERVNGERPHVLRGVEFRRDKTDQHF